MHNYSRKRWRPDPALPPDELAAGLAEQAEEDERASRPFASIREWYENFRHIRELRRILRGSKKAGPVA